MYISNCCGAKVAYIDKKKQEGVCVDCKEHCGIEETGKGGLYE